MFKQKKKFREIFLSTILAVSVAPACMICAKKKKKKHAPSQFRNC